MSIHRHLVFDTETTGLFPKRYGSDTLDPHMIQLSYLIYEAGQVVEVWNNYIRLPSDIKISQEIENLTGATNEICQRQGISVVDALINFVRVCQTVDIVIAHNIEFDKRVVRTEILRNVGAIIAKMGNSTALALFSDNFPKRPAEFCTIEASRDLCAIVRTNSRGTYFKNPTLTELYEHLFGVKPAKAHNSLDDCESCLRCYLTLTN